MTEINDEIEIDTLNEEDEKIVMTYGKLSDASWNVYKAILSIQSSSNYTNVTSALIAVYSKLCVITEKLMTKVEAIAIVNDAEPSGVQGSPTMTTRLSRF